MDKKTNAELMRIADQVLTYQEWRCPLFKGEGEDKDTIHESYNGQVSSFGVSVLTIGLKPTISVFYQDAPAREGNRNEAYRRYVLDVFARMLSRYKPDSYNFGNAIELCRAVIGDANDSMKTDIVNCSIALKEVIRTYNLG